MFKIRNGNKFLEGTENSKFNSEKEAIDFLFTNGYCLVKEYVKSTLSIMEKWYKKDYKFFPYPNIEIIEITPQKEIMSEISNALDNGSHSSIKIFYMTANDDLIIVNNNGDRFILTCNKIFNS